MYLTKQTKLLNWSKECSCIWTKTCLLSCTRHWLDLIWNGNIIWYPYIIYVKRQSVAVEQVQRREPDFWKSVRRWAAQKDWSTWNYTPWKGEGCSRGDLIETYKIFNNFEVIEFHNLFSLAKSDKPEMLKKRYAEHYNTNWQKYSFGIRVACHWNTPPTLFKNAHLY